MTETQATPPPAKPSRPSLSGGRPSLGGSDLTATKLSLTVPRVLVVDDSRMNYMVAKKLLERISCSVTIAKSGQECLTLWRQGDFEMIFLDCIMPEMTGFEVAKIIRDEEKAAGSKRIPIVALTSNDDPAHQEHCLSAGMDDFLCKKDVVVEALQQKVSKWTGLEKDEAQTFKPSPSTDRGAAGQPRPAKVLGMSIFSPAAPASRPAPESPRASDQPTAEVPAAASSPAPAPAPAEVPAQ
eukprot:TRINITY_DN787_c0_g1_i6.p1 TRINITY_DN787_c0_g1~~TRINITY_DN787_c0_g1_i6.p1  ORF type:complete len:252 (+),score=60.76 TRINITY_DN787_c0_g1_i6:37-756(+)